MKNISLDSATGASQVGGEALPSVEDRSSAQGRNPMSPRVLIVVSGGVADYISDEGVDVEIFDRDNFEDDPEGTAVLPSHFADLAAQAQVPVQEESEPVKTSIARVLVVVSGGLAEYVSDEGVDVEIFDRDDFEDDPEWVAVLPSHFADLAAAVDVPVEASVGPSISEVKSSSSPSI